MGGGAVSVESTVEEVAMEELTAIAMVDPAAEIAGAEVDGVAEALAAALAAALATVRVRTGVVKR